MLGEINIHGASDSTHRTEKINSSSGAHGLRYHNDNLQYYDNNTWRTLNSRILLYRHLLTFEEATEQGTRIYHVISIISTKEYTALEIFRVYQPGMSSGGNVSFGTYPPYSPPTILSATEFARYSESSYRYYYNVPSNVFIDYCYGRVKFTMENYDVIWTGTEHTLHTVSEIEF